MIQDISQTALALAVLALGLVVALELRSLKRLRGGLARDLERLFEQLDLVRFESQRLAEAQHSAPRVSAPTAAVALPFVQGAVPADYVAAGKLAANSANPADAARRGGLAAGEARVLAALQKMRSERGSTH